MQPIIRAAEGQTRLRLFWQGLAVNSASTLAEAVGIVSCSLIVEPTDSNTDEFFDRPRSDDVAFSDVRVPEFAKGALVTAASGGHSVLMF